MSGPEAADIVRAAVRNTSQTLTRFPGREMASGLHEVKELGPSLRDSLLRGGNEPERVVLNRAVHMANWNRATSQVDLVLLGSNDGIEIAIEMKAWDIGHQLFDLAKVCCILAAGARTAFLLCVAKRDSDFDRLPGGELFPKTEGKIRTHDFPDLVARHRHEWRRHVGNNGPEPTGIPTEVTTSAILDRVPLAAYPGHSARAVQVAVTDHTSIPLINGWPEPLSRSE